MSDERLRVTRVPVGRMKTEDVLTMLAADFRESEHREISTALFRHAEDVASMRAERDRLRAALQRIAMERCQLPPAGTWCTNEHAGTWCDHQEARRALNPEPTT